MRRWRLLGAIGIVAALGVGIIWTLGGWRQPGSATAVVTKGGIDLTVAATGRVEPVTEVALANKIPGKIAAILVKEGDRVTEGQVVIRFDAADLRAQEGIAEAQVKTAEVSIEQARAGLEAARTRWIEVKSGARPQEIEQARAEAEQAGKTWEHAERERDRFMDLYRRGLIARSEFDRAERDAGVSKARLRAAEEHVNLLMAGPKAETVDAAWALVKQAEKQVAHAQAQRVQAQASLEHARALLANTVLRATVSGVVSHKLVEPGEAVDIGKPLLVLADVRKTIVKAEVDETDAGKIALGQVATVTADAYPGRVFRGTVIEIAPAVGKRTIKPEDPSKIGDMKILKTKIEVENPEGLRLGMSVEVKIQVARRERALVLPRKAVGAGSEGTVMVVQGGRAEPRRVRLGLRDHLFVEVLDGLQEGDRVQLAH